MSQAIIRTYERFGVGTATRTRLNVSLREGSLAAFAYVLHLEFPEPGMYSFERLFDGPMHKWLLWDQQWMVQQLYRAAGGRLVVQGQRDRPDAAVHDQVHARLRPCDHIVALAKESHR